LAVLRPLFAQRTTASWQALLTTVDVPHAPVLAIDETLAQPQVAARQMILETVDAAGHAFRVLGGAIHWPDEPPRSALAPPLLGQHTDEVLAEWLAYDSARIAALRADGVAA